MIFSLNLFLILVSFTFYNSNIIQIYFYTKGGAVSSSSVHGFFFSPRYGRAQPPLINISDTFSPVGKNKSPNTLPPYLSQSRIQILAMFSRKIFDFSTEEIKDYVFLSVRWKSDLM
jgi:hypothetical protein